MTTRYNTNKESKEMTDSLVDEASVKTLDGGGGCPPTIIQVYNQALHQEAQTLKMFAKAQEQVRTAIKLRLDEILESIDPKNMGKSREILVENGAFNRAKPRTDTDKEPCVGENPFFVRDYQSVYDPFRFKENTIITMINMARGENKDVVKELKDAKKKLLAAQREAKAAREALKDMEDNKVHSSPTHAPIVSFEFDEDDTLQ